MPVFVDKLLISEVGHSKRHQHQPKSMEETFIVEGSVRMDFPSLQGLYGRDDELRMLESELRCRVDNEKQNRAVWVSGGSGSGKSALVHRAYNHVNDRSKHNDDGDDDAFVFASGKFEQLQSSSQPFSALVSACSELCQVMSKRQHSLSSSVLASSDSAAILENVLPDLQLLLRQENKATTAKDKQSQPKQGKTGQEFERLQATFRTFFQALSAETGVILFLDDLHWADQQTMEIVHSIVADTSSKGILFVGSYRENELNQEHHQLIDTLNHDPAVGTSTLRVENLKQECIARLIGDLTHQEPSSKIDVLAHTVFCKTRGNPFYTLCFLRHMEKKRLIEYSMTECRWVWDVEAIQQTTEFAGSAVDVVNAALGSLPRETKTTLSIASSLGSRFPLDLLRSIVTRYKNQRTDADPFLSDLEAASKQGLIEFNEGLNTFMFQHDRIQQAAYNLVADCQERDRLHYKIGKLLADIVKPKNPPVNPMLPTIVLHMNRGGYLLTSVQEKIELARLNLTVAHSKIKKLCFWLAIDFLRSSDSLLGNDRWAPEHYNLSLDLYSTTAEVLYCLGQTDNCLETIADIYENTTSPNDKHRAQFVHLEALSSANRLSEGLDVGRKILSELGERFPTNPLAPTVLMGLLGCHMKLKRKSDADLLDLPKIRNPAKVAAMRHLGTLVAIAFFVQRKDLVGMYACRMIELSLRYGSDEQTSFAFAIYAFGLTTRFDFANAHRFAMLALKVMDRFQPDRRTLILVYGVLSHLRTSVRAGLPKLLQGYRLAMEIGDKEHAFHGSSMYMAAGLYAGIPLGRLALDLDSFISEAGGTDGRQELSWNTLAIFSRYIVRLIGHCRGLRHIEATLEESELDLIERLRQSGAAILLLIFWFQSMICSHYFDYLELAIIRGEKAWACSDIEGSNAFSCAFSFFSAVTALRARQTTKKGRYMRVFRRYQQTLLKWTKNGYPNCRHYTEMLEAEHMVFRGKARTAQIKQAYDQSIATAMSQGYQQDAAFANERAADFLLSRQYVKLAAHYLDQASGLYEAWGAAGKVKQLEEKHYKILRQLRLSRGLLEMPPRRTSSGVTVTTATDSQHQPPVESESPGDAWVNESRCFTPTSFSLLEDMH